MAETRMCPWCGLPIESPYGQQVYHTLKNGGRNCGRERHVKMQAERRRLNRGAVIRQCPIDGTIFSTYDHRNYHCSDACAAEDARRHEEKSK